MTLRPAACLMIPPIALLLLAAPGCVSKQNALLKTEVQDLQNRIYELQKRNAEAQVKIQELSERAGASPTSVSGGGKASQAPPPASGGNALLEPEVPGSTIDLGGSGPTRNLEHAPEGEGVPPAQSVPGGGASQASSSDPVPAPGGEEADKLYTQGYAQFNSGDYPAAEQAFQEFLARAPESDLADDAQYWIGECFFSRKDFRRAILEFRKLIDQYPFGKPGSPRLPETGPVLPGIGGQGPGGREP